MRRLGSIKMNQFRQYSFLDHICIQVDQAVRAMAGKAATSGRSYPANSVIEETPLTDIERKHVSGLMRVNHAGEVCAQALYHAQGLVSRRTETKEKMQTAMIEEGDHLAWCEKRLQELGSHVSYLNPVWYSGAFMIGLSAGLIGDAWSLGFLSETETQVVEHLENHLNLLPLHDKRSHVILEQMRNDEAEHREEAIEAGANELPRWIKKLMKLTSKVMVKTAYWL